MIRYILKPQKNNYIKIIVQCPESGTWGQLCRRKDKLYIRHKTLTGETVYRLKGQLLNEMEEVYNLYGTKPF